MYRVYSCRAECFIDVAKFVEQVAARNYRVLGLKTRAARKRPGTVVQFRSDAGLRELQAILRSVPDGHLMRQTLRACRWWRNRLKREQAE